MDVKLRNKRYDNYLREQVQTGNFAHFMLFAGQKGSGKMETAMDFAKNVICDEGGNCAGCANCKLFESGNHPDIMIIGSSMNQTAHGGSERIKIAEIRELNQKLSLKPYQAGHKIAIVQDAHLMTEESANAMLKTLEEPPEKSIIILIAEDKSLLPETIVSRSQLVDFGTSDRVQATEEGLADAREILESSSLADRFHKVEKYGKDRKLAGDLLDGLETILRRSFLDQDAGVVEKLELLARSRQYLNRNLSARFVLENLIISVTNYQ